MSEEQKPEMTAAEILATQICNTIIVHGFENDASCEKVVNSFLPHITELVDRGLARARLVERRLARASVAPINGAMATEPTEAMIWAGIERSDEIDAEMQNYVCGVSTDWDTGMKVAEIWKAMGRAGFANGRPRRACCICGEVDGASAWVGMGPGKIAHTSCWRSNAAAPLPEAV